MKKHQAINQTSSIGANWPPVESSHNRLRGFYDVAVLDDEESVIDFAGQFEACRLGLESRDRLSIRAVARSGSLAMLGSVGVQIEGAIPLAGQGDLVMIYTGWNRPARNIEKSYLAAHRQLLVRATERGIDTKDRLGELAAQGFSPKIVNGSTPERQKASLVPAFTDMYGSFGYDQPAVEELLINPANTIAYIQDGSTIVSTSMAEHGTIEVGGLDPFNIVEVTEASTRSQYRQRGLYKAISGYMIAQLLSEIQNSAKSVSAIYGESNLAMPGVVFAASENGRRFSHFDVSRFGINRPDFGILSQNFRVEDGVETRPYNDFALSYVLLD